jgi:hypothetical protein
MNLSALSPPAHGIAALLLCACLAGPASAHDWYSPACCSGQDCAPIPSGTRVTASPNGYDVVFPSGERVFFAREKVQPSQDGQIHACIGLSARTPYCLYLPAGS